MMTKKVEIVRLLGEGRKYLEKTHGYKFKIEEKKDRFVVTSLDSKEQLVWKKNRPGYSKPTTKKRVIDEIRYEMTKAHVPGGFYGG